MPIKWDTVQLPFGTGQDDSTHDHALKPPTLETLENAVFEKTGTITKRKGFDQLTRDTVTAATAINTPRTLFDSLDLEASSSQYAGIADTALLDITGDITLECWFRPESGPAAVSHQLMTKYGNDAGTRSYRLHLNTTTLRLQMNTAGTEVSVTWNYVPNTWYHVAVTREQSSGDTKFYIDAVQQGSTQTLAAGTAFENSTAGFNIGALHAAAAYADGKFSVARLWNVVRTQSQIADNMELILGPTTNLIGEWTLNDTYADNSGNGLTLTSSGAPVFDSDVPFNDATHSITAGSSSTLSAAETIFTRENELALLDGQSVYSYSPDQTKWLTKSNFVPFDIGEKYVYNVIQPDSTVSPTLEAQVASVSGLRFLLDSNLKLTVTDEATGAVLYNRYQLPISPDGTLDKFYLLQVNTLLHIIWAEYEPGVADYIYTIRGMVLTPTSSLDSELAETPVDIHTESGLTEFYWAAATGGSGASAVTFVSYMEPAGTILKLSQNALSTQATLSVTGLDSPHDIACSPDAKVGIIATDGTSLKGWIVSNALALTHGPTTLGTITALSTLPSVVAHPTEVSAGVYKFVAYYRDAAGSVNNVYTAEYQTDNTIALAPTAFKPGLKPAVSPFVYGTRIYIGILDTRADDSLYLFRDDGWLVGRLLYANAYEQTNYAQAFVSGTSALIAFSEEFGGAVRPVVMSLDFDPELTVKEVAGIAYISGNILQTYDGEDAVESGFMEYPNFTLTASEAGSGLDADATYGYKVFYCWRNNLGQIERSSFTTKSVALAGAQDSVSLSIPCLQATNKENVFIEIYRTEGAGSTYYLINAAENAYLNDRDAASITVLDSRSDATITAAATAVLEPFPEGTLDPIAPRSAGVLGRGKRRLFAADKLSGDTVYYSKYRGDGEAVSFNDALVVSIPDDGGLITGIGAMDDVIVVFKENRIYAFTGDGSGNTVGSGQYSEPSLVTTDTGCSDQRTIVTTPAGLVFMSAKGIHLLTRALEVNYIGGAVEDNDSAVVDGVLLEDEQQVRFLSSSGKTLVWDYGVNQWSTFTGVTGVASCIWRGIHTYVLSTGYVRTENPTSYQDNAGDYSMLIETGWITLNGLQGFQRIRRALILGKYHSAHALAMSVGYDYVTSYPRTETYTYSSGRYQARVNMTPQKCEAIRFKFVDTPSGTRGKCVELSSLELQVGVKQGLIRQASSRTVG